MKQDYQYKEIFQHATGVGTSSNRGAKAKAKHKALANFLKNDVAESSPSLQLMVVDPEPSKLKEEDLFVFPWMGVLVNVPTEWENGRHVSESGTKLKEQLSKFNPVKVVPLWNYRGHTGNAIIDFSKGWSGFQDAMVFEAHFEAKCLGKKNWYQMKHSTSEIYGWVARADDYQSGGPIGDHLHENGELKTTTDLTNEESCKTDRQVANLANKIEVMNKHLQELGCKYNQINLSRDKAMEEMEARLQAYNIEIQKMQCLACDHSCTIFEENDRLRSQLDSNRKELDLRCKQLDKLVARNDMMKSKLDVEKQKNAMRNSSLQMTSLEQKTCGETVLKLVEEQKREKEAALNKILHLEKELDAKRKLELEIQQLKGKLNVMKYMGGDTDFKRKMEEMSEELQDKIEEMEALEALNQTLVVKERTSNDEHQDACKELTTGLSDMLGGRTSIGIKRMCEIDEKAFQIACKRKFAKADADTNDAVFCSEWQENLKDPEWHPFKVITNGDKSQNAMRNSSLQMTSLEQKTCDETVLKLVEEQKREKEAALNKILHLEKELDAKRKLELEIQQLKGKLNVMKYMGGDTDFKRKMEEMSKELQDKIEEMEALEALNQTLVVKERTSNDEHQDTCKEFTTRMCEIDEKAFQIACKRKFAKADADTNDAVFCSEWQENLKDPEWHPFKVITNGDKSQTELASMVQMEADEDVLKLVEEQMREKEVAMKKILQLDEQFDQKKQQLELEIEQLKGR